MDKTFFAGLGDGREGAIAYGQATDGFDDIDIEQFLNFDDPFMPAQNNEDSNAIMAQPEPVACEAMPNRGRSQSAAAIRARADRAKVKRRRTEMEGMVEALTQENEALKNKVRASKAETTSLNQALKSQGEEMENLKRDLKRLMDEDKKRDELVIKLAKRLVGGSDFSLSDEEIQKLNNEIDLFRQGKGMDSLCSCSQLMKDEVEKVKDEVEKVKDEVEKVKHELKKVKYEKRALKV